MFVNTPSHACKQPHCAIWPPRMSLAWLFCAHFTFHLLFRVCLAHPLQDKLYAPIYLYPTILSVTIGPYTPARVLHVSMKRHIGISTLLYFEVSRKPIPDTFRQLMTCLGLLGSAFNFTDTFQLGSGFRPTLGLRSISAPICKPSLHYVLVEYPCIGQCYVVQDRYILYSENC